MCTRFTFATYFNSSTPRCVELPGPPDAKFNAPGCARASATSSFAVFTGTDGWTIMMTGADAASDTGAKSVDESYGSLE
jgi:hypothetical protein